MSSDARETKGTEAQWDTSIVKCPGCTRCFSKCHLWETRGVCLWCDYRKRMKKPLRQLACDGNNCDCGCKLPAGFCEYCCARLVPIGDARGNGAPQCKWPMQRFHKKCWKELNAKTSDDEHSD